MTRLTHSYMYLAGDLCCIYMYNCNEISHVVLCTERQGGTKEYEIQSRYSCVKQPTYNVCTMAGTPPWEVDRGWEREWRQTARERGGGGDAVTDREREQRNSVKFPFL